MLLLVNQGHLKWLRVIAFEEVNFPMPLECCCNLRTTKSPRLVSSALLGSGQLAQDGGFARDETKSLLTSRVLERCGLRLRFMKAAGFLVQLR